MKESEELQTSRAAYLEKLKKYGAISMPVTAHYTAGYNDGSAILQDVADLCEEAERSFIAVTKQRDELLAALERFMDSHEECTDFDGFTAQIVSMADYHQAQEAIASVKGQK